MAVSTKCAELHRCWRLRQGYMNSGAAARRLNSVATHVGAATGKAGVRASVRAGSAATSAPELPTTHPLSAKQQLAWAQDGFLAFVVDDLPAEQLREAYDHVCHAHTDPGRPGILSRSGNFELDGPLRPLLDRMLSSPHTRGALASLLGDDFVASGAWVGGPGYTGDTHDQQFHKDDTHIPVRDHCTRYVNLFFMPGAVDDAMGPTEFLAGSHMLAMDREGMGHGEERLDPNFQAPRSLAGWHEASMSWEGVSTAPGQVLDYDKRDRRLAEGLPLIGSPRLQKAVCAAGTCVLWHENLFHRKSRQRSPADGPGKASRRDWSLMPETEFGWVPWRVVFRFGFQRASEPQWRATSKATATKTPLADYHFNWLQGARATPDVTATELEAAAEDLNEAGEAERVRAGYRIGTAIRSPATATAAVEQLSAAVLSPKEGVRRAAAYGLGVGGSGAVPALLRLLTEPETARHVGLREKLLCAVGEAAEPGCPGGLLAIVTQLGVFMAEAHAVVARVVGEISPAQLVQMQEKAGKGLRGYEGNVFWGLVDVHREVEEARGVLATGARSLGFIAARAVQADEEEDAEAIVLAAFELLLPLLCKEDLGAALPSRYPQTMLARNAATAFLNICSNGTGLPALLGDRPLPSYEQMRGDASALDEAIVEGSAPTVWLSLLRLSRTCHRGGASSGLGALRARCVEQGWASAMAGELHEC